MRLSIERMTYGPDAIAHTEDGKCVFVSGAIAGDVVRPRHPHLAACDGAWLCALGLHGT